MSRCLKDAADRQPHVDRQQGDVDVLDVFHVDNVVRRSSLRSKPDERKGLRWTRTDARMATCTATVPRVRAGRAGTCRPEIRRRRGPHGRGGRVPRTRRRERRRRMSGVFSCGALHPVRHADRGHDDDHREGDEHHGARVRERDPRRRIRVEQPDDETRREVPETLHRCE